MKKIYRIIESGVTENEFWNSVFCKALYVFVLIKLLLSWPIAKEILTDNVVVPGTGWSKILFAPLEIMTIHYNVYFITFLAVVILALVIRLNYITAFLVFWFSVSYSKIILPLLNGTDLVLSLFLLIAVLIPVSPVLGHTSRSYQYYISSFCVLLIKVQIALIYFCSGYDKLITASWRNGSAIYSIQHLDFFNNPFLYVQLPNSVMLLVAWMVILFEILFPVLIWFNALRKYLLLTGVLFHLAIVVFLGLLDFGVLMIVSYTIFLPLKNKTPEPIRLRS